jgi:hypothetical protein
VEYRDNVNYGQTQDALGPKPLPLPYNATGKLQDFLLVVFIICGSQSWKGSSYMLLRKKKSEMLEEQWSCIFVCVLYVQQPLVYRE